MFPLGIHGVPFFASCVQRKTTMTCLVEAGWVMNIGIIRLDFYLQRFDSDLGIWYILFLLSNIYIIVDCFQHCWVKPKTNSLTRRLLWKAHTNDTFSFICCLCWLRVVRILFPQNLGLTRLIPVIRRLHWQKKHPWRYSSRTLEKPTQI